MIRFNRFNRSRQD